MEFLKKLLIKDNNLLNNEEIIKNIIKTKIELNNDIKNYEYAEDEQIDYFLYKIKANKAKLDYLIKKAKQNQIQVNNIEKFKYEA